MLVGGEILKGVFKEGTFSELDIAQTLKLSLSKAHYVRLQLSAQHEISRVARGHYTFGQPTFIVLSPAIEFLRHELQRLNKKYAFTSVTHFTDFFKEQPYDISVVYVEQGAAALFEKKIEKLGSSYVTLIDPEVRDFELLKNKAKLTAFIVIRENAYFYSAKNGMASVEKAFVDLYFDVTRKKVPLPDKTPEILEYLIQNKRINFTTLLKCAHERGLKNEIIEVLRVYTKKYRFTKIEEVLT